MAAQAIFRCGSLHHFLCLMFVQQRASMWRQAAPQWNCVFPFQYTRFDASWSKTLAPATKVHRSARFLFKSLSTSPLTVRSLPAICLAYLLPAFLSTSYLNNPFANRIESCAAGEAAMWISNRMWLHLLWHLLLLSIFSHFMMWPWSHSDQLPLISSLQCLEIIQVSFPLWVAFYQL